MGRRHDRGRPRTGSSPMDFELERTLAAAEEDAQLAPSDVAGSPQSAGSAQERCSCGSSEFLLEAYLHVVDGRPRSELVEVETLTCPQCGREYEAVQMEDGRILRGELQGQVSLEDEEG